MKLSLDCLPCLLRQSLEAARLVSDEAGCQHQIVTSALAVLTRYRTYETSPQIARDVHRLIKEATGCADPYRAMKEKHIQAALSLYETVRSMVRNSPDPLMAALKAAAVGNMIDAAIFSDIQIEETILDQLTQPMARCDIEPFRQLLPAARTVLVIGDNAGESVFDRFLCEWLDEQGLTVLYAVKSQPIINDATLADAIASGLDRCTRIIESGCDSPGTLLEDTTDAFRQHLAEADIVISKGQGNFEGLSDCDRRIFFLLKAKCPLIARAFGARIGDDLFTDQKTAAEA